MNRRTIKMMHAEIAAIEAGITAPGRVWTAIIRDDGTVLRELLDPEEFRRAQADKTEASLSYRPQTALLRRDAARL